MISPQIDLTTTYNPILAYPSENFASIKPGIHKLLGKLPSVDISYLKFPNKQRFPSKINLSDNKLSFIQKDNQTGLNLTINILFTDSKTEGKFSFESFEPSVSASVLCTRLLYLFITSKEIFLIFPNTKPLKLEINISNEFDINKILYPAKIFRKLQFIEETFNLSLGKIPTVISGEEISRIDTIIRGITRGNVFTTAHNLTLYKPMPLDVNLSLFKNPSPISFDLHNGIQLFGKDIPVGSVMGIFGDAILDNPEVIEESKHSKLSSIEVRFRAYRSEQLIFHFRDHVNKTKQNKQKLENFRIKLLKQEPSILANLVMLPLHYPLTEQEATEIGTAWIYSSLGDNLKASCKPQQPTYDPKTKIWKTVYLLQISPTFVDSSEQNSLCVNLLIHAETGQVIDHPTPEQLKEMLDALKDLSDESSKTLLPNNNNNIVINKLALISLKSLSQEEKDLTEKALSSLSNFPNIVSFPSNVVKLATPNPTYIFKVNNEIGILFKINKKDLIEVFDIIPLERFENYILKEQS